VEVVVVTAVKLPRFKDEPCDPLAANGICKHGLDTEDVLMQLGSEEDDLPVGVCGLLLWPAWSGSGYKTSEFRYGVTSDLSHTQLGTRKRRTDVGVSSCSPD
jgi:hypothetical protein